MAGAQLGAALRQIQRLFSEGSSTGLSDTQLLAGFAARRDEAAFAALVARHGPMVLAVCRGILRDQHDAEDAFQATFLVLARKAGSAWAEGQLGGWLHKVAYRIAVRASADAARRRAVERRAAEEAAVEYTRDALEDDLRPALHEEVARLPAKLRLPVVLCYLEGLTHAQAAVALRCGEATLRRRLAGARERLRLRLARRGFEPSAAALGGALAKEAGAAVPPVCAEATVRAAIRVAAGEAAAAVVGTRVAHLTRGGLNLAINGWNMTVCVLLAGGRGRIPGGWHHSRRWQKRQTGGRSNQPPPHGKADSIFFATSRCGGKADRRSTGTNPREDLAELYNQGDRPGPRRQARGGCDGVLARLPPDPAAADHPAQGDEGPTRRPTEDSGHWDYGR